MATAVDDEVILRNPCRIRGAGTEIASERPILTPAEVARLAEVIEPRYRLVVLLAVYGSLRWGELMGLQRGDLDLDLMTLTVRRSVSEVGGRLVVKGPKSRAGLRTIALPLGLREEIEQHLDAFAEDGPEGRLFVGHRGNTLHRSNWTSGVGRGPVGGRRSTRGCTCTTCATRATTSPPRRGPAPAS